MSLPVLSSCPGQWDRPNRRLRPYRSVSPKPSREKQMLVVSKRLGDLSSCPPFFKINLAPKELQTNQAAVPVASALNVVECTLLHGMFVDKVNQSGWVFTGVVPTVRPEGLLQF